MRGDSLFHALIDFAAVMKNLVEITRTNNIAAMAVFDQVSLKKELAPVIEKLTGNP